LQTQIGFYDGTILDPDIDGDRMLHDFVRDTDGGIEQPQGIPELSGNELILADYRAESPVNRLSAQRDAPPPVIRGARVETMGDTVSLKCSIFVGNPYFHIISLSICISPFRVT